MDKKIFLSTEKLIDRCIKIARDASFARQEC